MAREKVDSLKVMELYNTSGGHAAREFINTKYNIDYPRCVITRLRKDPANGYDKSKDKFFYSKQEPFIELDELCTTPKKTCNNISKVNYFEEKMDKSKTNTNVEVLLQELVMEKLLEITKYISLNHATGRCIINKKSLVSSGYLVEID